MAIGPDEPEYEALPSVGLEQVESGTGIINLNPGSRTGDGRSVNFLFDERHVLYGKLRPYLNKVALPGFRGRCSTELIPLLPAPETDRRFLAALLRRPETVQAVMAANTGSRMPRADLSVLLSLNVPRTTLEEQHRVVDILDRAASIRRLRRQAQENTRQIVPALFTQLFGSANLHSRDWPIRQLGDLLAAVDPAIRTGPFGSQLRHSEFVDQGVPVLGIDNVVSNEFRWTVPRCIPDSKFDKFRRFMVRPRDLLITIMGTTGRCAIAPNDLPVCMSTKHLCVITLDQSVVSPEFVWAALLFDPSVRSQVARTGHGAIMEGWNMGLVKRLKVRLPPMPLQVEFLTALRHVAEIRLKQANSIRYEEAVSAALAARLLG